VLVVSKSSRETFQKDWFFLSFISFLALQRLSCSESLFLLHCFISKDPVYGEVIFGLESVLCSEHPVLVVRDSSRDTFQGTVFFSSLFHFWPCRGSFVVRSCFCCTASFRNTRST
jgi:hypothetical protein